MSSLQNLTIAIPVRNEENNLVDCLEAVGSDFACHVVIIDSNSTDSTTSIAHSYGVDVVNFNWNGKFPKKRNWFLRHRTPSTDWVFFLDADEIITPAVKLEVSQSISNTIHQGFLLNYTNYFLGRRLRGGYPLRKLALFRVGDIEYERIDENSWSQCDMEVHEHPIVQGSVGIIKSKIEHRDLRGMDSYMSKHNEYAAWEAHRIYLASSASTKNYNWSVKQRLKYALISSHFGGIIYFFGSFFLMGGWKDGSVGFAFAILKAGYFTQISCRLEELKCRKY